MSKRIHIHLDDETAKKVQALSLQEDRSISNMHRVLLNEALGARTISDHQLSKAERLLKEPDTISSVNQHLVEYRLVTESGDVVD